jgi:hypothetical protein
MLTAEKLMDLLCYYPETGSFRFRHGARAGREAGGLWQGRYWRISVGGQQYLAHRLAWLYVHGKWPPDQIDHVNANGLDNRLANLRLASQGLNNANRRLGRNNTSGIKGVRWHSGHGKWYAGISIAGRQKHLGTFTSKEEATQAYRAAAKLHFGEFART